MRAAGAPALDDEAAACDCDSASSARVPLVASDALFAAVRWCSSEREVKSANSSMFTIDFLLAVALIAAHSSQLQQTQAGSQCASRRSRRHCSCLIPCSVCLLSSAFTYNVYYSHSKPTELQQLNPYLPIAGTLLYGGERTEQSRAEQSSAAATRRHATGNGRALLMRRSLGRHGAMDWKTCS